MPPSSSSLVRLKSESEAATVVASLPSDGPDESMLSKEGRTAESQRSFSSSRLPRVSAIADASIGMPWLAEAVAKDRQEARSCARNLRTVRE